LILDLKAQFQKDRLCKTCSRNQSYLIQLLATWDSADEKHDDLLIDSNNSKGVEYTHFLDHRYPLCTSCTSFVQLELQRQDRWLRSYLLNTQLVRSKFGRIQDTSFKSTSLLTSSSSSSSFWLRLSYLVQFIQFGLPWLLSKLFPFFFLMTSSASFTRNVLNIGLFLLHTILLILSWQSDRHPSILPKVSNLLSSTLEFLPPQHRDICSPHKPSRLHNSILFPCSRRRRRFPILSLVTTTASILLGPFGLLPRLFSSWPVPDGAQHV
jgi:hypothetical protein